MNDRKCPYVTSYHVGGNNPTFVGRDDILRNILQHILSSSNNSILLYGQRRIGKTSILRELESKLRQDDNYFPVFFDLQDKADFLLDDVLEELAERISEELGQETPDKSMTLEKTFCNLWLPDVFNNLPAEKSLVLLFDEFDVLDSQNEKQANTTFIPYLRNLLTKYPTRLKIVFVIGRNIDDISSEKMLALFKAVSDVHVSLLKRKDIIELVRFSEKDNNLYWQSEAVERVWQLTNGHPFLTQHLCRSIFFYISDGRQVTLQDVEENISNALESSESSWEWFWKGLVSAEQRVMTSALAEVSENTDSNRIITENDLKTVLEDRDINDITIEKLLRDTLPLLEKWDLIELYDKGGYCFRIELLRQWFAKYKPLNRLQDDLTKIKERKETADILYNTGSDFYKKKELDTAKNNLERALISNPYHKKANQLLAKILMEERKYEEARKVLKRLHKSQPEAAKEQLIAVLLELANLSMGEYGQKAEDEQLQYYQEVLELDSNNEVAEIQLREIWQQRGNKALRIENESNFEQALNQASDKELDDALKFYQKSKLRKQVTQIDAEQHRRTMLAGWYQQAKKALDEGDKFKAQQRLIQVINEKPTYGEAIRYLHIAVTNLDPTKLKEETKQLKTESSKLQLENDQLQNEKEQLESEKAQWQFKKNQLQDDKKQLNDKLDRLKIQFKWSAIGVGVVLVVFITLFYNSNNTLSKIIQQIQQEKIQIQQEKTQIETETKKLNTQLQFTSEKLKVFDNVVKNYKRFNVAIRPDFSPFSYLNEKGERVGFEVDIVREFARRWFKDETAVIFRPITADYDIDSLINYQSNFVTTIANTENFSKQLDFSVSYFQDNKRLLVRQNSDIEDFCDIKGKIIAIVKGSLAKDRLQVAVGDNQCELFTKIPEKYIRPFDTHSNAFEALKKNQVEVMVADRIFLERFLKNKPPNRPFRMVSFSGEEELYRFGVLKGNERFLNLVNYTLKEMMDDKTYAKISCKWFQTDRTPDDSQFSGLIGNDPEPELVKMAKANSLHKEEAESPLVKECLERDAHQHKNDNYPIHHVVQKNDNLWDLAEYFYKDGSDWKHIYEANKGKPVLIKNTPSGIKEGETLTIPEPPN